jgi:cell volume regulation protein A
MTAYALLAAVTVEHAMLGLSVLLLLSVLASKAADRVGVPALLLFLVLGMLAGSEGLGGVYFDDAVAAKSVGVVALALILFSGGLDTDWRAVRPVLRHGLALSTVGVAVTALVVGLAARFLLGFTLLEGLLFGAIVSSTDAAAVFAVLRSKDVNLRGRLKPLLEFESGSNDPMAVFLTVSLLQLMTRPAASVGDVAAGFLLQMPLGALAGYTMGRAAVFLVNRLHLGYEGLYAVLTLSLVLLTYGLTEAIGGNGFLAVYLAGIVIGNRPLLRRRTLLLFHDGLAWLMQIAMFLTLGLLVFPSRLVPVVGDGLLLAACLMLVARPVAVLLCLLPASLSTREKVFVSWVGLRGSVPVVLATYPLLAGVPRADELFNLVFFVVLTSVLIQGASVPLAARLLRVDAPAPTHRDYPLEFTPVGGLKSELKELPVAEGSPWAGRAVVDLGLPSGLLIVLIARGDEFIQPKGETRLAAGDTLLVLAETKVFDQARAQAQGLVAGDGPDRGPGDVPPPPEAGLTGAARGPADGG